MSRAVSFIWVSILSIILWDHSPLIEAQADWPTYGNDPGGGRYSAESQINRTNVNTLKVAWTYRTGAMESPTHLTRKAAFEATPILVAGMLFLSTPYNHVIALDPQTGSKRWEYDPGVNLDLNYSEVASRGVSAWRDPSAKPGAPCSLRIFIGTLDARLIALDGNTGKLCPDFGSKGIVDLNQNAATQTVWTGGYQVTSPPAIYRDFVIVGSSIADNWRVDTGRGIVRAFDARSGTLRWTWDPIPWAQNTSPRTGAGNAWSVFFPSIPPTTWFLFPPAAPLRIISGESAKGTTNGPTRWWLCALRPASWSGDFKWCITTCGTTTLPHSPP